MSEKSLMSCFGNPDKRTIRVIDHNGVTFGYTMKITSPFSRLLARYKQDRGFTGPVFFLHDGELIRSDDTLQSLNMDNMSIVTVKMFDIDF